MKHIEITLKPIGRHKEEVLTFEIPVDTVEFSDYTLSFSLDGPKDCMTVIGLTFKDWYLNKKGMRKRSYGCDNELKFERIALIPTRSIKHIISK
jgi:hypothetical protein